MATKKPTPKSNDEKTEPEAKLETEIVASAEDSQATDQGTVRTRRAPIGRLFWGLFFVSLGVLFLLQNLEIVDVDFSQVWQLWPLLLVLLGLSLLSIKSRAWRIVATVAAIMSVVLIVTASLGYFPSSDKTPDVSSVTVAQQGDAIRLIDLNVKSGAGNLKIDSHSSNDAVIATLDSDIAKLQQSSSTRDGVQTVEISTDANKSWWLGSFRNDLSVTVTEKQLINLSVDFGASSADIDLSRAQIQSLNVKTGASSLKAKLGDKVAETSVNLEAGASSIDLHIPIQSGVRIELDSGLSSTNFSGLIDKGDGIWESPDYDAADKKIEISAKIGAGSLDLIRY